MKAMSAPAVSVPPDTIWLPTPSTTTCATVDRKLTNGK